MLSCSAIMNAAVAEEPVGKNRFPKNHSGIGGIASRWPNSMSELQPIIPREENQHGNPTIPPQDTPEPVPITEQEVGEYREQDRFLPVSFLNFTMTNLGD